MRVICDRACVLDYYKHLHSLRIAHGSGAAGAVDRMLEKTMGAPGMALLEDAKFIVIVRVPLRRKMSS